MRTQIILDQISKNLKIDLAKIMMAHFMKLSQ